MDSRIFTLTPMLSPIKPVKVLEHETLSLEKRKKLDRQYYEDFPEILEWYDKFNYIKWHNKFRYEYILELLKEETDPETISKLQVVSEEFRLSTRMP